MLYSLSYILRAHYYIIQKLDHEKFKKNIKFRNLNNYAKFNNLQYHYSRAVQHKINIADTARIYGVNAETCMNYSPNFIWPFGSRAVWQLN
jgi:hypothetical protein